MNEYNVLKKALQNTSPTKVALRADSQLSSAKKSRSVKQKLGYYSATANNTYVDTPKDYETLDRKTNIEAIGFSQQKPKTSFIRKESLPRVAKFELPARKSVDELISEI